MTRALLCWLALLPLLLAGCSGEPAKGPTVLAAASLQEPLESAAAEWVKAGHTPPVLSFAGTPTIARQLEAGAPADLVVTADAQWMDELAAKGRIDADSRAVLATNTLVLIEPARGAAPLESEARARAALTSGGRIAMADPGSVPAGRYGRAAITSMGAWPAVAPRVVPTESVRAALALVERGAAPLGVVYATDARASAKVRVVWHFETGTHPLITYPLALASASTHRDAGDFRAWLLGPPGQRALSRRGFGPPPS